MKVLVTGAAGYVGRRVAERLSESVPVVGIDVADVDVPFDLRHLDVRDAALRRLIEAEGVTHVVHLAAVLDASADPPAAFDIDVNGTANVIAACAEGGVGHLTVTSSGAAYGYHADNPVPLTEDDRLRGNAEFPYSDHKRRIEELLAAARSDHPDLRQLVLRVGTVLGPGMDTPVTKLFTGRFVPVVAGTETPFVFIWDQDLVTIIATGVAHDRVGVFNVAGDGTVGLREIARVMGGVPVPVPAPVFRAALRLARMTGIGRYGPEQLDFLRYRPVLDATRLKTEFGYVPSRTSREALVAFADRPPGPMP